MAESTIKRIKDRLHKMVKDIRTSNGYSQTIEEVNDFPISVENIRLKPVCNIVMSTINYITAEKNSAGRLIKKIPVVLDLYFEARSREKENELFTDTVQDLEIRFGDDTAGGNTAYNMDGSAYDLEGLVQQVNVVNATLFDSDGQDLANITFEIDIIYRQMRRSATTFYC